MAQLKKLFFFIAGWACLGLVYVGWWTPGVPYVPFLIGASMCFARSSSQLQQYLYDMPEFGPAIRNWEVSRSIARRHKISGIVMMLVGMAYSAYMVPRMEAWIGLIVVGAAVSYYLITRPEPRYIKQE